MKKIALAAVIMLMLIAVCSCSSSKGIYSSIYEKYMMDDYEEQVIPLDESIEHVYPYNNIIYAASVTHEEGDTNIGVGCYDLKGDRTYRKLADYTDTRDMYVNKNGIYLVEDKVVHVLDFDGNLIADYSFDDAPETYFRNICATDEYIFVSFGDMFDAETRLEDYKFYTINIATGEILEAALDFEENLVLVSDMEPSQNKDEILIIGTYNEYDETKGMEVSHTGFFLYSIKTNAITFSKRYDYYIDGCDYNGYNNNLCARYDNVDNNYNYFFEIYQANIDDIYAENYELNVGTVKRKSKYWDMLEEAAKEDGRELTGFQNVSPICFYTGYDYIMYDTHRNHSLFIMDQVESEEEITVIYPQKSDCGIQIYISEDVCDFQDEYNAKVNLKYFPYEDFTDRMRMKILAGEDDYDVVYLADAYELLPSLLEYGLCLPLENYGEITSAYDIYFDGVKDVMTYDGHIFGVPFALSGFGAIVSGKTETYGVEQYETLDEFWETCAALEDTCGNNLSVAYDEYVFDSIMYSYIETGMQKGEFDRDELGGLMENYCRYVRSQALGHSNQDAITVGARHYVYKPAYVPMEFYFHGIVGEDNLAMTAYPSVDGKNYVSVDAMYYVNSKSRNPDLAVKYLAGLMTEEKVYRLSASHYSCLAPGPEKYFMIKEGNSTTLPENGYRPIKFYNSTAGQNDTYGFGWRREFVIDHTGEVMKSSAPRVYSYALDEVLDNMYYEIMGNKLTADEAADKLYSEIRYRLLE